MFLAIVRDIAADAAAQSDPDTCLRHLRAGLLRLGYSRAGVWVSDDHDPTLFHGTWGTSWEGDELDEHTLTVPSSTLPQYPRIIAGERVVVSRIGRPNDPKTPAHRPNFETVGPPNTACLSLRADGGLLGLIFVDTLLNGTPLDPERVAALTLLADQVAVAVARGSLVAALRASNEALGASEASFRLLFQANPQPMWVYDLQTLRFLEVNAAAITHYGYSRDEFLGMDIADIRPPEEVPRLLTSVHQAQQGIRQSGQWRHRCKDGRLIDVEITSCPLEFGGRRAVLVVATDVTERVALENQLRQSQKMESLGVLAGGVAHDFNNLLTVIGGFGELLLVRTQPGTPERVAVEQILLASTSAAGLTHQLLTFSRREVVVPLPLDLNAVVSQTEKLLGRLIGEDVTVRLRLAPDLGVVRADPGQIEQILFNLATNARDAMPRGGFLTIETANAELDDGYVQLNPEAHAGPQVLLAVSDTGTGIAPDLLQRIFEPFFTTKPVGQGTGLGLAAVYGIVKQHGGSVYLYSEVGIGTTFKIYFPRLKEGLLTSSQLDENTVVPRGVETILLVEDDARLRALVQLSLESSGYRVLEAGNVEQAIRVANDHPDAIQLLLTDMVLPGLNGREGAAKIQRLRPTVKVLYMTGYTDDIILRQGVLYEGLALLHKPFTLVSLAQKVRHVLDTPT